jgi:FemAB-related protein (PEP-CTERM system-associated)
MPLCNEEIPIRLETTTHAEPPSDWDEFIERAPGGTFCHLGAWRPVMADVLGHECLYVTARDGSGSIQGALPLVSVRSLLFGHYLVSVPFLNYGGPVGSGAARRALTEWAGGEADRRGVDLMEFRWRQAAIADSAGTAESASSELPAGFGTTGRKITVVLPLPSESEKLWEDGLKSKVRSQVRRPMKEGFDTRFGADQVDAFYEVFARNMRDLGTPVLPKALFERLPSLFGADVTFAVVYDGDVPIAGGCGFHFGDEFELTWASSLREYNRSAPNMLLYWRLMEDAIARGADAFNFGRCTPGGGTHRFKSQWGGEDEPLPWAAWSPTGEMATPNPDQGKYKLATRVWSRLPVPVTRVLGPPLARRIP